LTLEINDAEAAVSKLTEDIKEPNMMISKICGLHERGNWDSQVGKGENKVAIEEDAHTVVANAVAVLTEFYKSSGEVPSLWGN